MPDTNPPRNAGKVAVIVVAILIAIGAALFVGMNFSHYQAAQSEENGQLPPDANRTAAKPQGPHDLGTEPGAHR